MGQTGLKQAEWIGLDQMGQTGPELVKLNQYLPKKAKWMRIGRKTFRIGRIFN